MSGHTPGPWRAGPLPRDLTVGDSLAVLDARGCAVCEFGAWPTTRERANAALIAKAPEMHELLREAVEQFHAAIVADEPVDGAEAVDWLADFVLRAHKTISG